MADITDKTRTARMALAMAEQAAKKIAETKATIRKTLAKIEVIAIGSSTGGTEALSTVLPALRPPLPPIFVVQHIPAGFSKMFAERMNTQCHLRVKEAVDGEVAKPNWIYIAPGELHMSINRIGDIIKLSCHNGPRLHSCRPAVDVLFRAVARQFKDGSALGVILTGIGRDGTQGLLEMKQNGATTIGQDEATSVVYGMPKAAFEAGAVEKQLPLNMIAGAIMSRVKGRDIR